MTGFPCKRSVLFTAKELKSFLPPVILICMGSCGKSSFLEKIQVQMTITAEPDGVALCVCGVCVCQSHCCFTFVCKQHYCEIYSKL